MKTCLALGRGSSSAFSKTRLISRPSNPNRRTISSPAFALRPLLSSETSTTNSSSLSAVVAPQSGHGTDSRLMRSFVQGRSMATIAKTVADTKTAAELCLAAARGDLDQLTARLDEGVNVNSVNYDNRTALHVAAANGLTNVVQFLLQHGANVNAPDRNGSTPLHDAVRNGHVEVVNLLKAHNASMMMSRQELGSELCKSASAGDVMGLRRFIEFGNVDVNQGDYDNRTALHLAASEGHVEVVQYLLSQGADVHVVDRFGGTPLKDALSHNTPNHKLIVDLLSRSSSAAEKNIQSIKHQPEFLSSLQKSLPILCDRGNWVYGEAWVPNREDTQLICSDAWYSNAQYVNKVTDFRQTSENLTYSRIDAEAFPTLAWQSKQPGWMGDIESKKMKHRMEAAEKAGFKSGIALPICSGDNVLCVLVFYSFDRRTPTPELMQNFFSFSSRLILASLQGISSPKSTSFVTANSVLQEQMNAVYNLIAKEGVFNATTIYQEVDWFYNGLGLNQYYFDHFTPEQIARHIHSFIAAKKVAVTTGNREDIRVIMEQDDSAFYLCPSNHTVSVEIEKMVEKFMERHQSSEYAVSLNHFRSKGTAVPYGTEHLSIFILSVNKYINPETSETQTDIWKISTGVFLRDKSKTTRDRVEGIIKKTVMRPAPAMEVFEPHQDGTIPIIFGFHMEGTAHSYMSLISELLYYNNITCEHKFVETFSNGVILLGLYLHPKDQKKFQNLLAQAGLLFLIPNNVLTPMFLSSQLTAHEYAYTVAMWRFCYYFLSRRTEEYITLTAALKSDPVNLGRLKSLQNKLKRDAVTEARIAACIQRYPDIMKQLYADFSASMQPIASMGSKTERAPQFNQSLASLIKKNVLNDLDQSIMMSFLSFNSSVLKTNFYKQEKAALAFRLDPSFLKDSDFPEVPYGLFLTMSNDFRGFHIRFRDVSRGGIRIIKSSNPHSYARNKESLFLENYNLAFTQQRKNKDIPEGGSKGALLLEPDCQDDAHLAFRKYVDSLLDLLLPNHEVVDHLGKQEILFLGPDENTAELMDWAATYARQRGASFWKAFTTGKGQHLGGIPHDLYGMTTRSVHRYVTGILEKHQIPEEEVIKLQTGGPDGDLGSNEILISKDKTIAVVDGSGVAYDPAGLNRAELTRLAQLRKMISHMDRSKLGPGGFIALVTDKDITLPNGEQVESGLIFRNEFHLHPLSSAQLFVPCGGRPEAININNVNRMFKEDGVTPRVRYIVEGANLFITQDARIVLEKAGVILFKDASTNKGGVTSSSLEVLAALSFDDEGFKECMQMREDGTLPDFYQQYVEEVQRRIQENAALEFECLWHERERTGTPSCVLTDQVSAKINSLNDAIQESSLWRDKDIRERVLKEALPDLLIEKLGLSTILLRVPEPYIKAIFGSYLASRYVYNYGINASDFSFFEFASRYTN